MTITLRPWLACLVLSASACLSACTQVSREEVASWREAVVAAREQSAASFDATNALIRETQFIRIPEQDRIRESDFTPGLDSASIARWMAALDALTTYASAVDRLLAPELPAGVGESLRKTGEQLGVSAKSTLLKSDGKLSAAIGSLGTLLVGAYAQDSARKIMLATDPGVNATLTRMADMIYVEELVGADPEPKAAGVLVTVTDAWDTELALLAVKYHAAPKGDRVSLARQYIALMDKKSASVEALRSLRVSLLQLASAHAAAAQGRPADMQAVLASIREQVKNAKAVLDAARAH